MIEDFSGRNLLMKRKNPDHQYLLIHKLWWVNIYYELISGLNNILTGGAAR